MWYEKLTEGQEDEIIEKLVRLSQGAGLVHARQLRNHGFARWLTIFLNKDVAYEEALQNRVLQTLRAKGRLIMNRGLYMPVPLQT